MSTPRQPIPRSEAALFMAPFSEQSPVRYTMADEWVEIYNEGPKYAPHGIRGKFPSDNALSIHGLSPASDLEVIALLLDPQSEHKLLRQFEFVASDMGLGKLRTNHIKGTSIRGATSRVEVSSLEMFHGGSMRQNYLAIKPCSWWRIPDRTLKSRGSLYAMFNAEPIVALHGLTVPHFDYFSSAWRDE